MRVRFLLIVLSCLATPAQAEPLQVVGYFGHLGEWELTATVTELASSRKEFSGPSTMKHTGICTQDGPEEKTGQMRFQMLASSMNATLSVDGVECTYVGRLSESYTGMMNCPDRRAVPLKIWVKQSPAQAADPSIR